MPWDPTPNDGWIDGSVDNDLPMTRLAEMFNVNHFIVSQVNPHVVPFLIRDEEAVGAEAQRESSGPGWFQNVASFAKGEALHRLEMLAEMGVFPNAITKARSVLSQRYSGDITILPAIAYSNFPKVLSNPTTDFMLSSLLTGEQATWPKLSRIRNHVAVELALHDSINKMRPHVHFNQTQSERRLGNLTQSADIGRARRIHTAHPTPSVELTSPIFSRDSAPRSKSHRPDAKLYLPSHPSRNGVRSLDFGKSLAKIDVTSSTDPEGSSTGDDTSSNDESDMTDIQSSPSPPRSPPLRIPDLWPSTRQVVLPSKSNPPTPAGPSVLLDSHTNPSSNPAMPPAAAPSSPELRYKRLFHPPTPIPGSPDISSDLQDDIQGSVTPLNQMTPVQYMKNLAENNPTSSTLCMSDPFNDWKVSTFEQPLFTPALSPLSTRDGTSTSKIRLSQQQQNELAEAERCLAQSRRGSAPLVFDYSGTRGMMLRKKRSRSSGFVN